MLIPTHVNDMTACRLLIASCLMFASFLHAFIPITPVLWGVGQRRHGATRGAAPMAGSSDDSGNMNDMRRLLEASWNADTMGKVPSTPEGAAEEAAASLQGAINKGQSLFYVDLLLPSYDITQGEHMYDEVLAVEFCIALAAALEDQTAIYVRDEKRRSTVSRILSARQRDQEESLAAEEEQEDDDSELDEGLPEEAVEFYDDFVDFSGDKGSTFAVESLKTADVDSFREQLAANWDSPAAEKTPAPKDSESTNGENISSPLPQATPESSQHLYRLVSMFGDANISKGSDMTDKVVAALKDNAIPQEQEDTLIILSAVTQEEHLAVRSLVGSYKSSKTIILVNCKLDPVPRELMGAETVYSILPLIAKAKSNERNLFQKDEPEQDDRAPPKIVVLRRFPNDWEVYVDSSGSGFELAGTTSALPVATRGPSMEWIAGCVKRHLESKLG